MKHTSKKVLYHIIEGLSFGDKADYASKKAKKSKKTTIVVLQFQFITE